MNTLSIDQILSQMGITAWQARIRLPGAKHEFHWCCYQVRKAQEVGLVVFERDFSMPIEQVVALLQAMMKAIGRELGASQAFSETAVKESPWVLTMGKLACEEIKGTVAVVQHPTELLRHPERKRDAWDVLKNCK